jgi:hypothetical protein
MSKPQNPPAFPRPIGSIQSHDYNADQEGMTLRDYFAGQALVGILANPTEGDCTSEDADFIARLCGKFADAMLAERST